MSRNPFLAKDDEWKQVRGQTAPAMTANKVNMCLVFNSIKFF